MQSWNYSSGGKGLASNGILPPSDALKTANCGRVNSFENPSFGGFMNNFSVEADSSSRHSCSVVDSNSRACNSNVDLELGRFGDPAETQNSRVSKGGSVVSALKPAKRVRLGVNLQITRCQVYGCNKDLSSCKEYHRRHKVCEVHSKTPKVIVNGIEQRFCQQCSRFHLLNEFDDGKRSCRKRLAGHNERRRKPQVGVHSGRSGRLLQSYNGFASSKYNRTSLASFVCQDILPNVPLNLEKPGANNWYQDIKAENGSNFGLPSPVPNTNGHLEKAFVSFPPTGTFFTESSNQYASDLTGSNASFVPSLSVEGLPGITNPGCALSLLSSQSQNFSSLGISATSSSNHYSVDQVSEKLLGVSSTSGIAHKFSTSGASSVEGSNIQFGSALVSNGSDVISFDGSSFMNAKGCLSGEDDATIDLLQLSSQLQRVEWQKQSMQVKQETDALYWHHLA